MTSATTAPATESQRTALCTDEAAALLGISPWLLLRVPHRRVGRRIVFSRDRLLEWLAGDGQ
jgi:hypothetical protein